MIKNQFIPQKSYNKVIQKYRQFLGLKQYVLAVNMGCSQQNISNCEKHRVLSDEKFKQLVEAMEVDIQDVIDFYYKNQAKINREKPDSD
jgi:ribosome-binding protein aMBF1 (putative translation factor)